MSFDGIFFGVTEEQRREALEQLFESLGIDLHADIDEVIEGNLSQEYVVETIEELGKWIEMIINIIDENFERIDLELDTYEGGEGAVLESMLSVYRRTKKISSYGIDNLQDKKFSS
ncbi:hypothetical protein [Breznakia pachnodae]|uniref:Uncharacterized protein n=1 Tax=Breznakia pachnodae TaxID=265178 RepID=A0ABU0E776_9FIRM|nr:hypothetical protein [Breznakia pachnodae]MDQ0362571.1 hypothetical protein [Breznakia pachnodae]